MATIKLLSPDEYESYSKSANISVEQIKTSCDNVKVQASQNNWEVDESATASELLASINKSINPELQTVENPDFLKKVDSTTTLYFGNCGGVHTYLGPRIDGLKAIPIIEVLEIISKWLKTQECDSFTIKAIDRLEESIYWLSKERVS